MQVSLGIFLGSRRLGKTLSYIQLSSLRTHLNMLTCVSTCSMSTRVFGCKVWVGLDPCIACSQTTEKNAVKVLVLILETNFDHSVTFANVLGSLCLQFEELHLGVV
jgi:hypothetical protein